MKKLKMYLLAVSLCFVMGCSTIANIGNNLNMFTIDDDRALGYQTLTSIRGDKANYPILDTVRYAAAYTQIRSMFNALINVGLTHRDDFSWKLYIIDQDDVLNAFAIPGGTVFIYTGLINYLENDSQLAGVLAHEISHIDLRHMTRQLTKQYGVEFLLSLLSARSGFVQGLSGVASSLAQLSFSRSDEYEADATATLILAATGYYDPYQTAGFFQKMMSDNTSGATIEWLSSHPSDAHRIAAIQKSCENMGATPFTSAQLSSQVASLNSLKQKLRKR
ncbi:MAG: M48 family metalloprotease [Bacteroidales bacterium]|nr:M48 family metalloprotease [Bacteroidales bacterium]